MTLTGSILMMINFFPPSAGGGVYRPLSFVKHLVEWGWEVTVVTPRPGEFWIADPKLEEEIPDEVRVIRTASLSGPRLLNMISSGGAGGKSSRSSSGFGLMRRISGFFILPDTYVGWVPFARAAGGRLCGSEKFDLIYSTSPPDSTHLAARFLARKYSIPWIADFRDPWISLYLRDPPTPVHRYLHRRMEKSVASADVVLVTTDWHKQRMEKNYKNTTVVKIANGYDREDFTGIDYQCDRGKKFKLTHCGMLTMGRSSAPLLKGLSILLGKHPHIRDEITVEFVGPRESENEEWARRYGVGEIVDFIDNLPHQRCVRVEVGSHVLLLIKHHNVRYRGLVPGKLFEYIGARRPVLAVVPEGEAADIIRSMNRGEIACISDPGDIAEKLFKMYNLFKLGKLESSYSLEEIRSCTRRAKSEQLKGIMESLLEDR
jgi:glycosyltransferase involved in cell wall biosynthesis